MENKLDETKSNSTESKVLPEPTPDHPPIGQTWSHTYLEPPLTYDPILGPVASPTPLIRPSVIVFFQGLFSFFNTRDGIKVGTLNHSPQHKNFTVLVKEYDPEVGNDTSGIPARLPESYLSMGIRMNIGDPKTVQNDISVDVSHPAYSPGTYCYQPTPTFERGAAFAHPRDFRWVLDFEGPEFYRPSSTHPPLQVDMAKVRPLININHAFFYTYQLTTCEFELVTEPGSYFVRSVGKVPLVMAANIYAAGVAGSKTTLRIGYHSIEMPQRSDRQYIVAFLNNCPCEYYPESSNPRLRNDFHHFYETFDVFPNVPFHLKKTAVNCADSMTVNEMNWFNKINDDFGEVIRSSDFAPCGFGGHSGGGGCC
jgi:hypothetical protein